jgi:3'(2'), 5'-bisphosphate nucleotidase
VEGRGAYVRQGPADVDERIQCASFAETDAGLIVVGSASHNTAETDAFVAQYKAPSFTQLGSSLKLLLVAEGAAHVYPRMAPTCEWDTAAAHAIVVEAGGEVLAAGECDSKGALLPGQDWRLALQQGQPVRYNKPHPLNPFFVVYGTRR